MLTTTNVCIFVASLLLIQIFFLWALPERGETIRMRSFRAKGAKAKSSLSVFVGDKSPPAMRVRVAHQPRYDLLGSFVLPTFILLAISERYGWELEILPFANSEQESTLKSLVKLGNNIDAAWGSGFNDASSRAGFDPVALNLEAFELLGFFPATRSEPVLATEWLDIEDIPTPDALFNICNNGSARNAHRNFVCSIWLPANQVKGRTDTMILQDHLLLNGGPDVFFPLQFRQKLHSKFMEKNNHRLQHYRSQKGRFRIAVHVRRGDILDENRWINQDVYASVVRRICRKHGVSMHTYVHVFSSGKNRDGNWASLEGVVDTCSSVEFHLDEVEFDTWTHMVAADALVMSKSTFSEVPALLNLGEVHFPGDYGHFRLASWQVFQSKTS